jgi:hypothetical protein
MGARRWREVLVVKVELHSAVTGEVTLLGQAVISNDGTGTREIGNYEVRVGNWTSLTKTIDRPWRQGEVKSWARLTSNVWCLVREALNQALSKKETR